MTVTMGAVPTNVSDERLTTISGYAFDFIKAYGPVSVSQITRHLRFQTEINLGQARQIISNLIIQRQIQQYDDFENIYW